MKRSTPLANRSLTGGEPVMAGTTEESGAYPRRLREDPGIGGREAPTLPPPPLSDAHIPAVIMDPAALRALPLDPRAGFLLSLIDGFTTTEDLLDISGMTRGEFFARLDVLIRECVVVLK